MNLARHFVQVNIWYAGSAGGQCRNRMKTSSIYRKKVIVGSNAIHWLGIRKQRNYYLQLVVELTENLQWFCIVLVDM